ncbi:TetR/AcrR family transcriptional regulator [Nocardia sp. CC227C]|uniref:TetR/AcrR family transcriptional regulator n=1 Tax=Nocardia sp. CC227C TaxID=3044562 RepID=UPI00278C8061|nr:TetR/AcrR family transcriptional regulator [Nocardia sp. CC227C]
MPRPRTHDPDTVLDAAESLAASGGAAAVTIRAVAAATGVSNGAIYHTFGSRAELLGRTWIRAARRFLDMQSEAVAADGDGVEAVIAAAETPAVLAERFPHSSTLLLTVRRGDLLGGDLPEPVRAELTGLDRALVELMKDLAVRLWDRKDARAVDAITLCLVDLPTAVLLHRDRLTDPTARDQLRAAVRAVLAVGPAPTHR